MKQIRMVAAVLAVVSVQLAAGSALSAAAAATPAGGAIKIWASPLGTNGLRSSILVSGAIGDYGTAISTTANGVPNPNGNFVKVELREGTFKVDSTGLNSKANKAQPVFNASTCSGWLSVTGPVTVSDGTGLYKGISGSLSITETYAFVLPRNASGAGKGQCNTSNNVQPANSWGSIVGTGTVHFA